MAKSVDVSTQTIRDIEAGRRNPSFELAGKIAKELGVKVSDLFETGEATKSNVLPLPISKALQKMSAIPDNIYDIAIEIPKDHEIWRMMYHALDGIREELEDAKNESKKG